MTDKKAIMYGSVRLIYWKCNQEYKGQIKKKEGKVKGKFKVKKANDAQSQKKWGKKREKKNALKLSLKFARQIMIGIFRIRSVLYSAFKKNEVDSLFLNI